MEFNYFWSKKFYWNLIFNIKSLTWNINMILKKLYVIEKLKKKTIYML